MVWMVLERLDGLDGLDRLVGYDGLERSDGLVRLEGRRISFYDFNDQTI